MRQARTLTLGLLLCLLLFAATWIGGARAAGGIDSSVAAERQLVQVLRGEHQRASYRRCQDEITRYAYPDVRQIPADRVRAVRRTWEQRVDRTRASSSPRAVCWLSHFWAESQAGRCVSSKEGGLRSVSAGGTYHGKWQADSRFQYVYGYNYLRHWGPASRWPEWAQDVMGYRGWQARGWSPWPNTARSCGLL